MKKFLLSIILALTLVLTASPVIPTVYAAETDPVVRLGYTIYVDCPFTLLSLDADDTWQAAEYIEPEFEVMPENVLWIVEPDQSYQMQVNLSNRIPNINPARLPDDTDYAFHIIYTGDVEEGGLGTLRVEFSEHINDVHMVYRSELKFVADYGANLFCTPDLALDEQGMLTVEFRPRAEGETYNHQFEVETAFAEKVKTYAIPDWTKATVYNTDLSDYLYPHGVPDELKWYFEDNPTLNPDMQPYRVAVG